MEGLMQDWPLTMPYILDYANRWHSAQEIVCHTTEGPVVTCTYADLHRRSQLCALALRRLGVGAGHVVGTLAWNTTRHMEAWYGIMGTGAVCHTLNPRLSVKDLRYIASHGQDGYILADITFMQLLEAFVPECPMVKGVILLTDRQHMPKQSKLSILLCYEELLQAEVKNLPLAWHPVNENAACGLCYTSGTTGEPKGVLYSHRSNWLHAMMTVTPDLLNLSSSSVLLMVVPMFHANSWGLAFAAPAVGAKLLLPGPHLDGSSIYNMLDRYHATVTAGVPTVWLNLINHLQQHKLRLQHLKILTIGGAAAPRSMIEFYQSQGVDVRHLWGMTETSPLGTLAGLKGTVAKRGLSQGQLLDLKMSQGRPHIFVDMRIVDDQGRELPRDGQAVGHLEVRGPHTIQRYYRRPDSATNSDKWFPTGDVASIDRDGYMRITDRSKDVIKSGGEWVSSIEIENLATGHPEVTEAAVIAVPDPKWTERPLLVVVPRDATAAGEPLKRRLLQFLAQRLAKFAVPDDVQFVQEIPHTATGKISKLQLREMFKDYKPAAQSKL